MVVGWWWWWFCCFCRCYYFLSSWNFNLLWIPFIENLLRWIFYYCFLDWITKNRGESSYFFFEQWTYQQSTYCHQEICPFPPVFGTVCFSDTPLVGMCILFCSLWKGGFFGWEQKIVRFTCSRKCYYVVLCQCEILVFFRFRLHVKVLERLLIRLRGVNYIQLWQCSVNGEANELRKLLGVGTRGRLLAAGVAPSAYYF